MKHSSSKVKLVKLSFMCALCIGIYIYFRSNISYLHVEDLYIPSAIGVDITKFSKNDVEYAAGISAYIFSQDGAGKSTVQLGKSITLPQTRQDRQLHSDHKFILGLEKVDIFSADFAKYGINPFINVTFQNSNINDTSNTCVFGGKIEELLNTKLESYPSIGDFLEGLLKKSTDYNFFSDNYKLMDIYVRLDAEGRNIVLPYVSLVGKEPRITGMALFNKDKMVKVLDIEDTRILNLLRENNVRGIFSLKHSSKEYLDYYAASKRKVKCTKVGNKYKFLIELDLTGDIASNTLMPNINNNEDMRNKFQEAMTKDIESSCNKFIEKMQKEYKVDCLELGRVAASKYGRRTGVDWNKIISEQAQIDVKVKAKINSTGRGEY
ncbi:Ger(x)C family spore germination protein [Haloimpatiens lingqiaonensis]|uniref:Ger(x)C family spore germination protein n=1 Tax=Haloimpatiens lingqiaonensis TaxID=1380675 RepID=UPI0010FD1EC6|nr:Ger(x)C family spore germination protein [Haloimpatiens lingqiaonensis]